MSAESIATPATASGVTPAGDVTASTVTTDATNPGAEAAEVHPSAFRGNAA
jgi:hypothetical protein